MDRIASFTINHLGLMPGLYVSSTEQRAGCGYSGTSYDRASGSDLSPQQ